MYEMWAEFDPAVRELALLWHVIAKHDAGRALCGRALQPGQRVTGDAGDGWADPAERYCTSCMGRVRDAMAAAGN